MSNASPSAPLARVTVHHFRHALVRPVTTVMGPLTHRPALLLEIEDADGARGWGEIWCNFPPDGDLHRARLAANVLPAALGAVDTDLPFDTFERVRERLARLAIQAGEPGPVDQISAAVDTAVHDLAARRAGVPLAAHLAARAHGTSSGQPPAAVPAYASGIAPDAYAAQMGRMRALGYTRFKLRIGFGPGDALDELEAAAGTLALGERLIADANQAWSPDIALERAARLGPLDLAWLEEPLRADAPWRDWQRLADVASMPLAGGENLAGRAAYAAAIASGTLAVIQPDLCKWGGLSGCLSVAREALAAGQNYCPHFLGGGIGLIASAQLLAASGGPGWLEVDSSENPLLEHFADGRTRLGPDGFVLPGGPGLGIVPDVDGVADLRVSREERRVVQAGAVPR